MFEKNKINFSMIITIFLAILISLSIYTYTSNNIKQSNEQEFEYLFKQQTSLIQREIDVNIEILESLGALFSSQDYVTRAQFKKFVQNPLSKYKSIQALEWIPKVTHDSRSWYEMMATLDLNMKFKIKSKSSTGEMVSSKIKDEYYPEYYVEPLIGNIKALGFDLSSNATRLHSLNQAKNTRKMISTARIKLVQEKGQQYGFLVFLPVWDTLDKENISGFVLGAYRIGDMLNAALKEVRNEKSLLDIWLVDTTNKNEKQLLFTNTKNNNIETSENFHEIQIGGRTWTLYVKPNELFFKRNRTLFPIISFIISMFVILLVGYTISLNRLRAKELQDSVDEKTKSLMASNKKIDDLLKIFDKKVIASRTDLKGKIIYVTSAFCKISGYSQKELIGQNHRIIRHPDMPKDFFTNLWEKVKLGQIFQADVKNKRKDDSFYWVDTTIFPEYDINNNLISYFAIREDITAKKEVENFNITLEEEIKKAVTENAKKDTLLLDQTKLAAMGEMIGAIAHQWRQPLNTLAMKVQFMEDDFEDGLIDKEYILNNSVENMKLINFMSKTIDDFRNFFTIDKVKEDFGIKEKITETTNMIIGQLKNNDIALEVHGDSFVVNGYPNEFKQVILNIVSNAKDALVENSINNAVISINTQKLEETGIISIKDNAGGIPQDVINRVFEPYFTTKEQGKGTGLGLYMSKMIIEDNMNGVLKVQNTKDGAEFILELKLVN